MLWLSLVCMIPFDLDRFDETHERGKTAEAIEGIAKRYLCRAGVEREGAALVLSRLYTRCVQKSSRLCSQLISPPERIRRVVWIRL